MARLAGDDVEGEHHDGDGDRDDDTDAAGAHGGATLEAVGQLAQHEHEQHRRQRLDGGLGEGEVGGALDDEQGGHPVADGRQEQHGGESTARRGRQQRTADEHDGDRDLRRPPDEGRPLRPVDAAEQGEPGSTAAVVRTTPA